MNIVYLVVTTQELNQIVVVPGADGCRLPRWDRRKRIPPAHVAEPPLPLSAYVNPADIVHWVPLPPRDMSDTTDAYCCVAVVAGQDLARGVGRGEFILVRRESVTSDASDILPADEEMAVRLALPRLDTPLVTFDSPHEVHAAMAWAEREIAQTTHEPVIAVARYRQNRRDLIVRFETSSGAVYLKAGKQRFADETRLTQLLYALLPGRVPETLAIDEAHHRWLYRELPGVMFADVPLHRHTIVAAIRALVSLQHATMNADAIARHVTARTQTAVDLFHAVDAFVDRAWRSVEPGDGLAPVLGTWRTLREAMIRACVAVDALDVPSVLVPSDFWSQNILVTPHGIGFIDLGYSFWSSPILPLWRFVRDIKRLCAGHDRTTRAAIRQDIGDAFVDAWEPVVSPCVMKQAIGQLWLIGRLFGLQIAAYDLDLYEDALGTELPPGYRATRLAPRVRDLSRAFAQHAVMPRLREPELASALDL